VLHLFPLLARRLTCSLQVRVVPGQLPRYPPNGYNPHHPLTFDHDNIHQCCKSSANDTGSTASRSQTSSATSSSLHLPLAGDYSQQRSYSHPPTSDGVVQDREGFPSAFGLMSLDDSEALAGLGNATSFDNAITNGSSASHNPSWGDGPTPMPTHAMPLLCMVRKVPTNSSRRIRYRREMFLLGRRQASRN